MFIGYLVHINAQVDYLNEAFNVNPIGGTVGYNFLLVDSIRLLVVCRMEMYEFPKKLPQWTGWCSLIPATIVIIHTEYLYIKL